VLTGSEQWAEALVFDGGGDRLLSFDELWAYLQARRARLARRFGAPDEGPWTDAQRQAANDWLSADTWQLAAAERSHPVKPAQVLGVVNALLIAGILTGFYRYRKREGQVFALMVMLYPVTRFLLESIRADNPHNVFQGELTHNQWTSIILLALGAAMWGGLRRFRASAGPALAQRVALAARESAGTGAASQADNESTGGRARRSRTNRSSR
jgi:hypothetical protein